jgi:hypothetical protein
LGVSAPSKALMDRHSSVFLLIGARFTKIDSNRNGEAMLFVRASQKYITKVLINPFQKIVSIAPIVFNNSFDKYPKE